MISLKLLSFEQLNNCSLCNAEASLFEVDGFNKQVKCVDGRCYKNNSTDAYPRRAEAIMAWNRGNLA